MVRQWMWIAMQMVIYIRCASEVHIIPQSYRGEVSAGDINDVV